MAIHKDDSCVTLVLKHLQSGKEINPMEAMSLYGTMRLGAVIFTLKKEGHRIHSRLHYYKNPKGKTKHYAIYKLEDKAV